MNTKNTSALADLGSPTASLTIALIESPAELDAWREALQALSGVEPARAVYGRAAGHVWLAPRMATSPARA